jgi:hypothetical protein
VSFFGDPKPQKAQVADSMTRLLKAFRQGTHVSAILREFLAIALPADHSPAEILHPGPCSPGRSSMSRWKP